MMANAMPEPEAQEKDCCDDDECECGDEPSQEFIQKVAEEGLAFMSEKVSGPLCHKVAMMMICHQMFTWHNVMAESHMKAGEFESAQCWSRDAGHFQVINNILRNITVGDNDFTCDTQDDD